MSNSFLPILATLLLGMTTTNAQIIERSSPLRPVSIVYAKATVAYQGMQIDWKVACYTIDESTGARAAVGDTVRGNGDSMQVRLIKYDLKYTYYKVFAASGGQQDSIEFQAFSKGSMQKYLFRIPVYASKPVPVHIYLPASFSAASHFLVVMHGIDRNAYSYGLTWTTYAASHNIVVIAPEFSSANWSSDAYSLGNMFTGSDGTGSLNIREKWTFTIVKDIQRTLARGFGMNDSSYTIWGHSAGGQFVHRMVLFTPDSQMTLAIAANPGWYTAPDSSTVYPWGTKHPFLSVTRQDLIDYTNRRLVLMRGTADTIRDSNLNTDSLSDVQGRNRYERAAYFYNKGWEVNPSLRWQLLDVIDSGHDFQKMATAAAAYLDGGANDVQHETDQLPRNILFQNYPNPFNPSTTLSYEISVLSSVDLRIFDLLGREVAVLVNEEKMPGIYTVKWNAEGMTSGVYFCRMTDGGNSSVIKLFLIK